VSLLPSTYAPARIARVAAAVALGALVAPLGSATAAPPANDGPGAPAAFSPVTAENGRPGEQQGIAELAEATFDPGVTACFGPLSFVRTVWFVVPATEAPQEITVEASGQTLDVLDLAAFVQPEGATGPLTSIANACAGAGSGGSDEAEEPTSAVTLRVPARRSVLIQVGRRGRAGQADDQRALLTLDTRQLAPPAIAPPGDAAGSRTPRARTTGPSGVSLGGATITEEDPAEPPCPSLGSVWRRIVPTRTGLRLITASGNEVSTLTVFSGTTPTANNVLDCVNRAGRGSLQMRVIGKRRKPLWIRLGTDRPEDGASASLSIVPGAGAFVVDGGPGGFDPTTGGPGGGLPSDCATADAVRTRIGGSRFAASAKRLNRLRALTLALNLRGGPVCDVEVELVGPRQRIYAATRLIRLKNGRGHVRLIRRQRLARGGYRLHVTALSRLGQRVRVRTELRGKLR
jgi:hypothetical protein